MADATNRPDVRTPLPQRNDLQQLIPDNVRLRRALEQLFIDVSQTLPDAVQTVGDNSQATTEDVSMGLFGATDRKSARLLADLSDAIDVAHDGAALRKLGSRVSDIERLIDNRQPVKARVERFIAPTLLNSWVNFDGAHSPAGYYKDPLGIVHLRGFVKSGTINTAIFTLPAGYRPAFREFYATISNDLFGGCYIDPNGDVLAYIGNNTYFSLDGITFRAA